MMNKIIRTTLIALLLTFAAHAAAQQGLQIATVFQKYGKQKGAVSYTHLTLPTKLEV